MIVKSMHAKGEEEGGANASKLERNGTGRVIKEKFQ